jgi:hypothetical protein
LDKTLEFYKGGPRKWDDLPYYIIYESTPRHEIEAFFMKSMWDIFSVDHFVAVSKNFGGEVHSISFHVHGGTPSPNPELVFSSSSLSEVVDFFVASVTVLSVHGS